MKDYHMHTPFGDGRSSIDAMAKTAKELGLEEIAFTEHLSWLFVQLKSGGTDALTIMPEDIEQYYKECKAAEDKHNIRVLKGFEIGYLERDRENLKKFISKVKPDLVLVGVHQLDLKQDWTTLGGVEKKAGHSVYLGEDNFKEIIRQHGGFRKVCERYFQRLNHGINAGFENYCQMVGVCHLNMFRREPQYNPIIADPFIDKTLELIAEKNLALEINHHYKNQEPRPSYEAAKSFINKGGKKIWFGSNSHSIESLRESSKHYENFQQLLN